MDRGMVHISRITDTHAHLCDPVFEQDRKDVLERAARAGVEKIICVGENISDAKRNLELAEKYRALLPAAGLYPSCLDISRAHEIVGFIKENREKIVAIGEVGLDYWIVKEEPGREIQKEIFGMFIRLSRETGLPINVHSRSAGRQALELLMNGNADKAQLHAFDGKAGTAWPASEAGFFFSIPPSLVRSRQKQKLVRQLPLSCLLIESDSPALGPCQGERNEPANTLVVVRAIAEIKGIAENEVIEITAENTKRLYGGMKGVTDEEDCSR
jgi:TatD DNase family protein